MGLSAAGLAAGYQGYAAAQRQATDDDLRSKAAARADQDAAFQEELRNRQRQDWKEEDRRKADDKADIAAANAKYDTPADPSVTAGMDSAVKQAFAAPTAPVPGTTPAAPQDSVVTGEAAPAWATGSTPPATKPALDMSATPIAMGPAKGLPQPNDFNRTLDKAAYRLRLKSERNDLSPEDYAKGTAFLDQMKRQGITDALDLMAQGQYDEALKKYNSTGSMNGASIVSGTEGTTKINGQDTPTHYVVIANADGTRTTMDVAKARYQLLSMSDQLTHQDRATQLAQNAQQHAATIKLGRDQLEQSAKDAQAGRDIQRKSLQLQMDQYAASTPLGQITAMGKVLGRPLTSDEIENRLGLSRIPRAVELQVTGLMKEGDVESAAMAKAMTSPEGINPTAATAFQKNAAIRNEKLNLLLAPYSGSRRAATESADPLNLKTPPGGVTVPNPLAPDSQAPAGGSATIPGQVAPNGQASAAGAAWPTPPDPGAGVRAAIAGRMAERNQRMDQFNRAVGGANQLRTDTITARQNDVAQNFNSYVDAIQPGMSRADQQRVLSWMDVMSGSGLLSNEQLRQVRVARRNAGL